MPPRKKATKGHRGGVPTSPKGKKPVETPPSSNRRSGRQAQRNCGESPIDASFSTSKVRKNAQEKKNALVLFKEYFATLSDKLLGVLFDDIMSHALFTNTDEEHHQRPHTDYLYPFPRSKKSLNLEEYYFAWILEWCTAMVSLKVILIDVK